jgi:hypothetical protein
LKIIALGLLLLVSSVSGLSYADAQQASAAYMRQYFVSLLKKPFDTQDARCKLLVIGDSHAQDFLNALHEVNALENMQISTRYVPTRCQLSLSETQAEHYLPEDRKLCESSDHLSLMQDAIAQADIVVLASSWQLWSAQQLPQTLKQLALKPTQQLIVVGRKSFGTVKPAEYANKSADELKQLRNPVDNNQVAINETLKQLLPANQFIDMQATICADANTCPLFTSDLQLISFDGGHLTQSGAGFVGRHLLKNPLVQALRVE